MLFFCADAKEDDPSGITTTSRWIGNDPFPEESCYGSLESVGEKETKGDSKDSSTPFVSCMSEKEMIETKRSAADDSPEVPISASKNDGVTDASKDPGPNPTGGEKPLLNRAENLVGASLSGSDANDDEEAETGEDIINADVLTLEPGEDMSLPIDPDAIILAVDRFVSKPIYIDFSRNDVRTRSASMSPHFDAIISSTFFSQ